MFPMYSSLIYHLSHPGQVPQSTCCLHPWQLENLTTGDKSLYGAGVKYPDNRNVVLPFHKD